MPKSRRLLRDIAGLVFLVVLALSIKIAFGKLRLVLSSSELFRVVEISIEGADILDEKAVLVLSELREGENIFAIDLKQVAVRVMKNPMIKTAAVARILPGRISIEIVERKPIALMSLDRVYGVDKEATLLPCLASFPSVPVITGANMRAQQFGERLASAELYQAIEFLQQASRLAPSLLDEISEIELGNPLILSLVEGSTQVKLSWEDFPRQILCLESVLPKLAMVDVSPRYIDLRFKGKLVVGT